MINSRHFEQTELGEIIEDGEIARLNPSERRAVVGLLKIARDAAIEKKVSDFTVSETLFGRGIECKWFRG